MLRAPDFKADLPKPFVALARCKVFDHVMWERHGDFGDNSIYYKDASIVSIRNDETNRLLFDVIFDHRPDVVSHGHFIHSLKDPRWHR